MDNSPTALFDSYEQDFTQITDSIRRRLDGNAFGEERKAALRRVEMELDEADEMLSQMEIELQGMPQSVRGPYAARARGAKSTLSSLKSRARDAHASAQRAALLGRAGTSSPFRDAGDAEEGRMSDNGDRSRLLAGTALLESGTSRLHDSERVALEAEETGTDILRELQRQREQIVNTRDTLHTADRSLDRASGTLKRMIRRMYQQRVVTAGIIIVLLLLIGIILWAKLS